MLVNHALIERDKVTLNLLWYSGMRLSEAANLKATDFNWEEGTVVVFGKGNRYRKALAGNGIVRDWFTKHESLGITADGISTMLKRLAGKSGGDHARSVNSVISNFCRVIISPSDWFYRRCRQ